MKIVRTIILTLMVFPFIGACVDLKVLPNGMSVDTVTDILKNTRFSTALDFIQHYCRDVSPNEFQISDYKKRLFALVGPVNDEDIKLASLVDIVLHVNDESLLNFFECLDQNLNTIFLATSSEFYEGKKSCFEIVCEKCSARVLVCLILLSFLRCLKI